MFNGKLPGFYPTGPAPGQFLSFPANAGNGAVALPIEYTTPGPNGTQHSNQAINTGATVLGIKLDTGVIIAADTRISYGNMFRYSDVQRVFRLNEKCIIGGGGDFADFHYIKRDIEDKIRAGENVDDYIMRPHAVATYFTRQLYARRSRMNPLLVDVVVGGLDADEKPYLSSINMRGCNIQTECIATGFGAYLVLPLLRENKKPGQTYSASDAAKLMQKCFEVLYYRDSKAHSSYHVAVCTPTVTDVMGPYNVSESWDIAATVRGY